MTTAELRRLAEAATPGPWAETTAFVYEARLRELNGAALKALSGGRFLASTLGPPEVRYANAAFIAACDPGTILRLLDVADAARRYRYAWTPETDDGLTAALAALDAES